MSSIQPGPDFQPGPGMPLGQPGPGMPPGQPAFGMPPGPPGQGPVPSWQGAVRPMSVRRILCGITWTVLTAIFIAGGIGEITIGIVGGAVLCFVLGICAGWYSFRVWTFRARRLWFIF